VTPVSIFTRAIIRREIQRARTVGERIDRMHLHRETGLPWNRLEKEISWAAQEIDLETLPPVLRPTRQGGGADGHSKTERPRASATARPASPTRIPTPKRHPAPGRGAAPVHEATPRTRTR